MRRSTLIFLAILAATQLPAQNGLHIDSASLYTGQGALIHIDGSLTSHAGSAVYNDGVIELANDISNEPGALFTTGTASASRDRAVKFIGTGTQSVTGDFSGSASSFYNLVVAKGASASTVQLHDNIKVKGSLVFGATGTSSYTPTGMGSAGNGIIKAYDNGGTDYEIYVSNPATDAIAGQAAHVIGADPTDGFILTSGAKGSGIGGLARNVNTTAAAYDFPIGTVLNGYNGASINFTSIHSGMDKVRGLFADATGGIGSLSTYCNVCNTGAPAGFSYFFPIDSCSMAARWVRLNTLQKDHGYWSFAGDAADTYTMEMYPNSYSAAGAAPTSTWRIIKSAGDIADIPSGSWTSEIVSDISTPTDLLAYSTGDCYGGNGIPGGTYRGFGSFQMAHTGSVNTALPVKLLTLTATPEDKYIRVSWATASEINNKGFNVQRSEDGEHFYTIGWADAQGSGTSNVQLSYTYNDETAIPGVVYYYRLDQVDYDGVSTTSLIVQAEIKGGETMSVSAFYPNPATDDTHISVYTPGETVLSIEIYDLLGQLIDRSELTAPSGHSQFAMSTSRFAAGQYKAVIRTATHSFVNSLHIIR